MMLIAKYAKVFHLLIFRFPYLAAVSGWILALTPQGP
jgi:hypothetical protein